MAIESAAELLAARGLGYTRLVNLYLKPKGRRHSFSGLMGKVDESKRDSGFHGLTPLTHTASVTETVSASSLVHQDNVNGPVTGFDGSHISPPST
jgi:hypothetical protein